MADSKTGKLSNQQNKVKARNNAWNPNAWNTRREDGTGTNRNGRAKQNRWTRKETGENRDLTRDDNKQNTGEGWRRRENRQRAEMKSKQKTQTFKIIPWQVNGLKKPRVAAHSWSCSVIGQSEDKQLLQEPCWFTQKHRSQAELFWNYIEHGALFSGASHRINERWPFSWQA